MVGDLQSFQTQYLGEESEMDIEQRYTPVIIFHKRITFEKLHLALGKESFFFKTPTQHIKHQQINNLVKKKDNLILPNVSN